MLTSILSKQLKYTKYLKINQDYNENLSKFLHFSC